MTPLNNNADKYESPVVFIGANPLVSVNYKASMLSNNPFAFNNSSQCKYLKEIFNTTYKPENIVYESMGKVWYERNTGSGWSFANNGALNDGNPAKSPSFDSWGRESSGIQSIVYQYNAGIKVETFNDGIKVGQADVIDYIINDYSFDCKPVMSSGNAGRVLVVWQDEGLYYRFGSYSFSGTNSIYWHNDPTLIPGTGVNSKNPSIYSVYENQQKYHVVWEEGGSRIIRRVFSVNLPEYNSVTIGDPIEIKASAINCETITNPVISINANNANDIRIAFIAKNNKGINQAATYYNHQYSFFGSGVNSLVVNALSASTLLAYYEQNAITSKIAEITPYYSIIKNSSISGKLAMNPCNSKQESKITGIVSFGAYYIFSQSNALSLLKASDIKTGKEGIIAKGDAAVYFRLGDIESDGLSIEFDNKPDSIGAKTAEDIAERTTTLPFTINDASKLKFSVYYGALDSAKAYSALSKTDKAEFEAELSDSETKEVLGSFEKTAFTKTNLSSYEKINYIVNTEGIGIRKVRLRLKAKSNFGETVSISNIYEESGIQKQDEGVTKQAALNSDAVVKEYALEQNYPNPFNPATTIRYALPKDGAVRLTIYNLLGQEVTTLVNEYKLKGRYEVKFDASGLGSGMYIYRIDAGSFIESRRMMLVK